MKGRKKRPRKRQRMPHRTKQDYVDFIAAHAPKMSVASLKRVARCVAEETKERAAVSKPPKPPAAQRETKPAPPRVHFAHLDDAA